MLEIEDIKAEADGEEILKGLTLKVNPGEIHAIMGPNGAGKSTLSKAIAGHPFYELTSGRILFNGEDLAEQEPEDRAKMGLFASFQYPVEVPGISNAAFLQHSYSAVKGEAISREDFMAKINPILDEMGIQEQFLQRDLNTGFSGGEKKKNEILQMKVLEPKCVILDETDSGLDIDALRIVADGINSYMSPKRAIILITHYQRLLEYVKPDFVHVMRDGKIVKSGGPELALELEDKGYQQW